MSASEPEPAAAPADLRAPLVALAVWAGAWCGVAAGWAWVVAAGLAVALALAAWRWRSRAWAVAAICTVAAGGVGTLDWWSSAASPLTGFAREKAVVTVQAVVTGDPVARPPRGALPGQVVVAVSVRRAEARGQAFSLRQTAWLVLPPDATGLAVGQTVAVVAKAAWQDDGPTVGVRLTALAEVTVLAPPGPLDRALNQARAGLRASLAHSPPDQAGLVPALVVGDTAGLPAGLVEAFRATGLSHLVAVSGTNLTLMVVFLVAAARAAGARGWWLRGVTVAGVVLFVALCRGEPSVLRAAAMGLVALAATGVSATPGRGLRQWGVAVAAICLLQPAMSHSWGFALSAAATAGILWWSPAWSGALRRWAPGPLADAIAVPLAAQLATQPLVTALNGQVSLVGLFANMVAAPFVGPVTVLGLVACLVSSFLPGLATGLGWLAGWCSQPIILIAGGGAALPRATLAWGAAQWGATAVALVALAVSCWLISRAVPHILRRWWTTGLALVVLGAATVIPLPRPGWPGQWQVAFCDVGQGDAAVVRVAEGVGLLVDAGPEPAALRRCLDDLGVRRLALVIFSHEHADHTEGARGLAAHVKIDLVLVRAGLPPGGPATAGRLLGDATVPVAATWAGQVVTAGPVRWTTLRSGPLTAAAIPAGAGDDAQANNASTIGLAEVAGLRVLFTGDAEPEEQAAALAGGVALRADVLKVPHHGSSRQDAAFLAATGAAVAVISVGAGNSYGHPAPRTVNTLQTDGMRIYRTDQTGALLLSASKSGLRVQPQHQPP